MSDNPFLLPPGGAKPPEKTPAAQSTTPNAAPVPDPPHYIAVPASVESVTHRIERAAPDLAPVEPVEPAEPVEIEIVKTTAPEPPIAESPIAEPQIAEPLVAELPVVEETRLAPLIAPASGPRAWALVLVDGTRVTLDGPLLLGRDPAGIPDRPEAGLLSLADTGKTVSKTHALLEPTPDGVRVRDLHSTNGVAVDTAAGRQLVTAGAEALAPLGATIMLGSFPLRVDA